MPTLHFTGSWQRALKKNIEYKKAFGYRDCFIELLTGKWIETLIQNSNFYTV